MLQRCHFNPTWVLFWRSWLRWRSCLKMWICSQAWPSCCPKGHVQGTRLLLQLTMPLGTLTPPAGVPTPLKTLLKERTLRQITLTLSSLLLCSCGLGCSPFCVEITGLYGYTLIQSSLLAELFSEFNKSSFFSLGLLSQKLWSKATWARLALPAKSSGI